MKSRTSSFNLTVLKKDITRFAPSWILYAVGLLVTFMICFDGKCADCTANALGLTVYGMAIVNFIYALINAQLLFGDLFQSRSANALHALPLRRESWFAIHAVSGLLFALAPNTALALIMLLFSGSASLMPWLWLLWTMGTYVFFFGLAVFCATCVGSRFALAVVYGIANFGSLLVGWLYETVYLPQLYGLMIDWDAFLKFSPVCYGTVNVPYQLKLGHYAYHTDPLAFLEKPENLVYLGILVAVGLVFGGLALVMYRKRHLEGAGDFIAAPWLKPIFLVLYTVAIGILFQWILGLFTGTEWLYLFIGLLVGFFTGQMLLMRTTRIFVKETFIGAAVLIAATFISLVLTTLDPLGVTRWVPQANEVAKVEVQSHSGNLEAADGEDLERLLTFHQTVLDNREEQSSVKVAYGTQITYTMKDGRTVRRYYVVPAMGTAHLVLEPMLSRPEVVLGNLYDNWDSISGGVDLYTSNDVDVHISDRSRWEALMNAIVQDCLEGNMIQDDYFHGGQQDNYFLSFSWRTVDELGDEHYEYLRLEIYDEAVHTLAWLEQQYWYKPVTN